MQAIKHIVIPNSRELNILLPENMVQKELEVTILPVGKAKKIRKKESYRSQKGKLSKSEAEKMLAYVEASRKEWP